MGGVDSIFFLEKPNIKYLKIFRWLTVNSFRFPIHFPFQPTSKLRMLYCAGYVLDFQDMGPFEVVMIRRRERGQLQGIRGAKLFTNLRTCKSHDLEFVTR